MTHPTAELPPHADAWVRAALGRAPLAETHATCATCAMCEGGGDGRRPRGSVSLQPETKCCKYRPALPNYLVGAILADGSDDGERGRVLLRQRMAARPKEMSPLGLFPPVSDPASRGESEVGCPHLDEGRCSIWRHRHAVCSTYFCKHERGALGHRAWLALRALLIAVERGLALWCCIEEGLAPSALGLIVGESGAVPGIMLSPAESPEELWRGAPDGAEAFFVACHARVQDLSWSQVLAATGPTVVALAAMAKGAFDDLDGPLPNRLMTGRYRVGAISSEGVLAETYSALDPIGLPTMLTSVLHAFDGRPLDEVNAELNDQFGVGIDDDFLRALVDFQVLVPVPE